MRTELKIITIVMVLFLTSCTEEEIPSRENKFERIKYCLKDYVFMDILDDGVNAIILRKRNGDSFHVGEFKPKKTFLKAIKNYNKRYAYLRDTLVAGPTYSEVSLFENEHIASPQILEKFEVEQFWIRQNKFSLYIFNHAGDFKVSMVGLVENFDEMVEDNKSFIYSIFNNEGCDYETK